MNCASCCGRRERASTRLSKGGRWPTASDIGGALRQAFRRGVGRRRSKARAVPISREIVRRAFSRRPATADSGAGLRHSRTLRPIDFPACGRSAHRAINKEKLADATVAACRAAASAASSVRDDAGRISPVNLQRQSIHGSGRRAHHRLPGGGRGRRRDHPYVRMRCERGAGFQSRPRQIIQDCCRQAGVGKALRDHADRQRRLVRRLDDERAAGGERGTEFPGVNVDRVIPQRDRPDDPDRRGHDKAANVRPRGGADRPAEAAPLFGVVAGRLDAEADFLFGVRNGLSLFARSFAFPSTAADGTVLTIHKPFDA